MDATSLLALPSSPAPSGLQIFAIFVNFFFPALALIVVTTRAAGRFATGRFGWDDWLVCIAMVLSVGETVISFFFIKTNFIGIPRDQIPPHDPTQGLIWAYAVQILYNPILALVKSSVLIFLSRLFSQKNGVRQFVIWLNVANIAQMVAVFLAITLQCLPVAFNWDLSIRGGRCVDRRILYTCTAVLNIVTDLLVLGLPVWIFVDLKIPKRTKFALLFVFLLGFLVTITSIVRLVLLVQGLFGVIITPDTTNIGFVTSAIETNLALITASAPALRPIFRSRARGGWFPRTLVGGQSRIGDAEQGGQPKPIDWDSSTQNNRPGTSSGEKGNSGTSAGKHLGSSSRGGKSRGGGPRRGSSRSGRSLRNGGRGGGKNRPTIMRVKTDVGAAEMLRSASPRSSEEETMTNNGIMRVSDIQREIDGLAKEIEIARAGVVVSRPYHRKTDSFAGPRLRTAAGSISIPTPTTTNNNGTSAAGIRPGTSGSTTGSIAIGIRRYPAERYYSESVYPDMDYEDDDEEEPEGSGSGGQQNKRDDRDYNDERISRYGDRRFGVVTPRGTTPTNATFSSSMMTTTRSWKDGGGTPF
ncbi:hypothetical protein V8F33_012863 [Rhypophila sp. PSN 637]